MKNSIVESLQRDLTYFFSEKSKGKSKEEAKKMTREISTDKEAFDLFFEWYIETTQRIEEKKKTCPRGICI